MSNRLRDEYPLLIFVEVLTKKKSIEEQDSVDYF